ncbi:GPI-GlcNAc transferase complex [Diplocarpon mali]|nr:GPI-GlcNAc transferase complex [Diplocarpon mali]
MADPISRSRSPSQGPSRRRSRSPPRRSESDRERTRDRRDKPRGGGGGFKWKDKRSNNDEREGGGKRLERGYRNRSRSPRREREKPSENKESKGSSVEDKFGVADKFGPSKAKKSAENTDAPPERAPATLSAPQAAAHGEPMIIVHVNDRLGTKAAIPCLASDPIKLFKAQVAARIGRQPHEILLKRQGERPFKDQLTLEDYGVSNGVQIDLEIDTGDPHLRTSRPSPTTVEYTVSTSPTLTLPLRLLIIFTFILRLAVALVVLLLLYSRYLLTSHASLEQGSATVSKTLSQDYVYQALGAIHRTCLGTLISLVATRTPLALHLTISLCLIYLISLRLHTTESLLVLRGLGIQTSSSSDTYLSSSTTRFIPTEKIQDILVNEAFRGFEVRYYLVVVVEGEENVVVVFPRLLPRRDTVEKVWRGCRACLFEGVKEKVKDKESPGRDETGGELKGRDTS